MKTINELTPSDVQAIRRCAEIMFPYFRGLVEEIREDPNHPHCDELAAMEKDLSAIREHRPLFY